VHTALHALAGSGGGGGTSGGAGAGDAVALREALGSLQVQRAREAALGLGPGAADDGQDPSAVEMPWWAYGPSGMQLWFPSLLPTPPPPPLPPAARTPRGSSGAGGLQPVLSGASQLALEKQGSDALMSSPSIAAAAAAAVNAAQTTDIELEFDREVYPVGVSLADASIVGITQRLLRVPLGGAEPCQVRGPEQPGRRAKGVRGCVCECVPGSGGA
jgi:hypothetical protein